MRFHGTLKSMFRKLKGDAIEWDMLLHFLLFAYREAPAVATGFSPHLTLCLADMMGAPWMCCESWVPVSCKQTLDIQFIDELREEDGPDEGVDGGESEEASAVLPRYNTTN